MEMIHLSSEERERNGYVYMGVTTKDLARICGVSRATVTRALHGTGSIRPETKQKILEAANELGYQPDFIARSLVGGSTMTIGVIVVDLKNQYFPKMLDAIEKRMKESDYLLNITLHENSREIEKKIMQTLIGHRVDGLILSPSSLDSQFWDYIETIPVPAVLIGHNLGHDVPTVGINEEKATYDAVHYIYERAYRDIVFVVPPLEGSMKSENVGHCQRVSGYKKAVRELGLDEVIIYGEDYQEKTLAYFQKAARKPAFLCSGSVFAIEILGYMMQLGYRVKEDFGVMGFDNIDLMQKWSPRLTTVNNHVEEIGTGAAEMLLHAIQGTLEQRHIEIPYEMIEGETI